MNRKVEKTDDRTNKQKVWKSITEKAENETNIQRDKGKQLSLWSLVCHELIEI
jgi:hypothetical protein